MSTYLNSTVFKKKKFQAVFLAFFLTPVDSVAYFKSMAPINQKGSSVVAALNFLLNFNQVEAAMAYFETAFARRKGGRTHLVFQSSKLEVDR